MKYRFIEFHRAVYPVGRMCAVLGVSRSGYYAWRERPLSERKQSNTRLLLHIRAVYHASRRTYGSRRVYHELREQGIPCSRQRIARLMRQDGLRAVQRQRYKQTTRPNPRLPVAPNVLNRDFTAQRPNQKWVADFTYIPTAQGWLYLATVMDVFSRQIVGWSMSERQQTALVEDALQMALARRCPQTGLLHHSDRGSQYASHDYQKLLAKEHIQVSMSRSGNCYDNAMMESFFATLKTEWVDHRYATRAEARSAIFDYIERWYNRRRRHSSLGYLSPAVFEQRFARDKFTVH
jgi:putative transposase